MEYALKYFNVRPDQRKVIWSEFLEAQILHHPIYRTELQFFRFQRLLDLNSCMQNNSSEMLIEAVCDLLPALVRKGGKQYAKIWNDNHWRLVQNCMKPKKPSGVRSAALGKFFSLICTYSCYAVQWKEFSDDVVIWLKRVLGARMFIKNNFS